MNTWQTINCFCSFSGNFNTTHMPDSAKITGKIKEDENKLVISYLMLRRFLGLLGIGLPVLLLCLGYAYNGRMEASISAYYHTGLREVFVIILSLIAGFLITYNGYDNWDRWITNVAGLMGFAVAFLPTTYYSDIPIRAHNLVLASHPGTIIPLDQLEGGPYRIIPAALSENVGTMHYVCAIIFLVCLAIMSIFQFTKGEPSPFETFTYRFSGIGMLVLIVAMAPPFFNEAYKPFYTEHSLIFWGETFCLFLFGTSWLVKGETFRRKKSG